MIRSGMLTAAGPAKRPREVVDLRSDTVTEPTPEMYERMCLAPTGDDGLDGDPTARQLEVAAAEKVGKEAGLFVPSCTMANLIAACLHARRAKQVVLEATSHMYTAEREGAIFANAFYVPVPGSAGAMDLDLLSEAIEGNNARLRTGMVGLETSHNSAGGTVLPLHHMADVQRIAAARDIRVHLDGARLFNAATHLEVLPDAIARHCDTVSLCLSKGLSAPVGAVLAGDRDFIENARVLRRALGGQQRQVGVVAAAGLVALESMASRLAEDHVRASRLSAGLRSIGSALRASSPQTNIVMVDVSETPHSAELWVRALFEKGILVRRWSNSQLRCVTHRHIGDEDVQRAVGAFAEVSAVEQLEEKQSA